MQGVCGYSEFADVGSLRMQVVYKCRQFSSPAQNITPLIWTRSHYHRGEGISLIYGERTFISIFDLYFTLWVSRICWWMFLYHFEFILYYILFLSLYRRLALMSEALFKSFIQDIILRASIIVEASVIAAVRWSSTNPLRIRNKRASFKAKMPSSKIKTL